MSSSQPEDADNTKREQRRRRMRRVPGAIIVAFMGLMAFYSVAGSPRFETFHTLDVIRLMTAGASIAVFIFLVIRIFNFHGPTSRT